MKDPLNNKTEKYVNSKYRTSPPATQQLPAGREAQSYKSLKLPKTTTSTMENTSRYSINNVDLRISTYMITFSNISY